MSIRAQGLRTWLWQRFTGAYLAAFVVFAFLGWTFSGPWDFASWKHLLADPVLVIAIFMFFAALILHSWVGVRDIIVDYMPSGTARFVALSVLVLVLIVLGVWVTLILLRVVIS